VSQEPVAPKSTSEVGVRKKPYVVPTLVIHGSVRKLTRSSIGTTGEGGSGMGMA
jgi:hypothetical protein